MKRHMMAIVGAGVICLWSVSEGMAQNQRIVHRVIVGTSDIRPPGYDCNFSLVANVDANGNATGQWQDTFFSGVGGVGGIHVMVDCVEILPPGNIAIVGGVITQGTFLGTDLSGQRVVTMVVDNGSEADDTPDQISFSVTASWAGFEIGTCGDFNSDFFPLFDITGGQVVVR